jgi:hypothetical protein
MKKPRPFSGGVPAPPRPQCLKKRPDTPLHNGRYQILAAVAHAKGVPPLVFILTTPRRDSGGKAYHERRAVCKNGHRFSVT